MHGEITMKVLKLAMLAALFAALFAAALTWAGNLTLSWSQA